MVQWYENLPVQSTYIYLIFTAYIIVIHNYFIAVLKFVYLQPSF